MNNKRTSLLQSINKPQAPKPKEDQPEVLTRRKQKEVKRHRRSTGQETTLKAITLELSTETIDKAKRMLKSDLADTRSELYELAIEELYKNHGFDKQKDKTKQENGN